MRFIEGSFVDLLSVLPAADGRRFDPAQTGEARLIKLA
jgi:hypothetical protein